jgi:hypothetical protein
LTVYLSDPIPVDRGSIRAQIDTRALALQPDLDTTSPGTSYDFLASIISGIHAEALQTLTQMLAIAFRGSLEKVDRIIQRDAVQATATAPSPAQPATPTGASSPPAPSSTSGRRRDPVEFQTVNDETFTGSRDHESQAST